MTRSSNAAAATRQTRLRAKYGPWAIVIGASDGIGRAMAIELAAAGMNLVLVARREELLNALASELGRRGTVRPGFFSKLLEASLLLLPRWGRSRIMAIVMGGMTRHQNGGKKQQERRPA